MSRITDVARDRDSVTITIDGVAVVGPDEHPWQMVLTTPRELYFSPDGSRRTKAEIQALLRTYIFSTMVGP